MTLSLDGGCEAIGTCRAGASSVRGRRLHSYVLRARSLVEVLERRELPRCGGDRRRRGCARSRTLVGRRGRGRGGQARRDFCVPAATAEQPGEKAPPPQELALGSGLVRAELTLICAGGRCGGLQGRPRRRLRAAREPLAFGGGWLLLKLCAVLVLGVMLVLVLAAALRVDSRRPVGEGSDGLGCDEVRGGRLGLDVVSGGRLGRGRVRGARLGPGAGLGAGPGGGVEGHAGLGRGVGRVGRARSLAG